MPSPSGMGDPSAALNFCTDYSADRMESCASTFNELVRVRRSVRRECVGGAEREKDA